jgi:outer membrane protein OmpA-like peptidoglycan-associated protein
MLVSASIFIPVQSKSDELTEKFERQLVQDLMVTQGLKIVPSEYSEVSPDLRIDFNIRFDRDSAEISEKYTQELYNICNVMASFDSATFQVVGHTDATGRSDYNMLLSKRRAETVVSFMVTNCTLSEDILTPIGMGEKYLAFPEKPESGENRRVEFQAKNR